MVQNCHVPSGPGAFSPEVCVIPVILEQRRRQTSCGRAEMPRGGLRVSCQSGGSVRLEETGASLQGSWRSLGQWPVREDCSVLFYLEFCGLALHERRRGAGKARSCLGQLAAC